MSGGGAVKKEQLKNKQGKNSPHGGSLEEKGHRQKLKIQSEFRFRKKKVANITRGVEKRGFERKTGKFKQDWSPHTLTN